MKRQVEEAIQTIRAKISFNPVIGVILGSGLGSLADMLTDSIQIEYDRIPGFPVSTVKGHAGKMVFGWYEKVPIVIMQGRFHYYEGYSLHQIVFPIYVLNALGVKTLIITNSAGGINRKFKPGDLMIIRDHINLLGDNPLIGLREIGERFIDLTSAYSPILINKCLKTAKALDISIQQGVYACMTGPSYETPAEIKMLSILGADAVGMSTVPEVIAARQCNMEVLAISCITNMAAGISDSLVSHEEVVRMASAAVKKLAILIGHMIKESRYEGI